MVGHPIKSEHNCHVTDLVVGQSDKMSGQKCTTAPTSDAGILTGSSSTKSPTLRQHFDFREVVEKLRSGSSDTDVAKWLKGERHD